MDAPVLFKSDAPLWYKVGIWGDLGYAVPNFGQNKYTVNETLEEFVAEGGKRVQVIMHHEDVGRGAPPTLNSVVGMVAFCNRTRAVVLGRAVAENELRFQSSKVNSPRRPFVVFPTPFFKVTNRLMQTFASFSLAVLAELMQTTETKLQHEISEDLAKLCGQYVARFQKRLGMEYFGMTEEEAGDVKLNLMDHLARYTPSKQGFVPVERLDVGGTVSLPQESDLGPLATGILVPNLPQLGPYPWDDTQAVAAGSTAAAPAAAQQPPLPDLPTN